MAMKRMSQAGANMVKGRRSVAGSAGPTSHDMNDAYAKLFKRAPPRASTVAREQAASSGDAELEGWEFSDEEDDDDEWDEEEGTPRKTVKMGSSKKLPVPPPQQTGPPPIPPKPSASNQAQPPSQAESSAAAEKRPMTIEEMLNGKVRELELDEKALWVAVDQQRMAVGCAHFCVVMTARMSEEGGHFSQVEREESEIREIREMEGRLAEEQSKIRADERLLMNEQRSIKAKEATLEQKLEAAERTIRELQKKVSQQAVSQLKLEQQVAQLAEQFSGLSRKGTAKGAWPFTRKPKLSTQKTGLGSQKQVSL